MRVLVAGASGVLGRPTLRRLVAHGHQVVGLVRSRARAEVVESCGAQARLGDVLDLPSVLDAAQGVEAILHLATVIPRDPRAPGAWEPNDRIRVEGTRVLLDTAAQVGARRYVQQSITRLYADHGDEWITEDSAVDPTLPVHLRSAVTMEEQVRAADHVGWVILRGGQFYGLGTGVTENMLAAARDGRLQLDGEGNHFMSMIHPEDMAQAVVTALEHAPAHSTYNVVDNAPSRQRELYRVLTELVGRTEPPPSGPTVAAVPSRRCSNAQLRSLGFEPRYPNFRTGVLPVLATLDGSLEGS